MLTQVSWLVIVTNVKTGSSTIMTKVVTEKLFSCTTCSQQGISSFQRTVFKASEGITKISKFSLISKSLKNPSSYNLQLNILIVQESD